MTETSPIWLTRPPPDAAVEIVSVSAAVHSRSRVEDSLEEELVLEIGTDASGRRVRLALGSEISVWWSAVDSPVLVRRYAVSDIRGGSVPTWRLRPLAPAGEGDRRSTPRAALQLPMGLVLPTGMLLGETADLSASGLRAVFKPEPTAGFGERVQPLPEEGDLALLALVLDGSRVDVHCRVVGRDRLEDGRRVVRVAFVDLTDDVKLRLQATTALELAHRNAYV